MDNDDYIVVQTIGEGATTEPGMAWQVVSGGPTVRTVANCYTLDDAQAVSAALTTLPKVAATLREVQVCADCVTWAAKGLPFCTPHALTLGGLLGNYIPPDDPK